MMKSNKSQKGASLIIVFIVCTAIAILLATTFIVVGNYNISVFSRVQTLKDTVIAGDTPVDGN